MNIRQACAFLGISAATLHRAMRRGEIPFRKLGSRTLFSRAVLLAWLAGPDATT
jgi:excisionase family DNA binding protein